MFDACPMPGSVKSMLHVYLPESSAFYNLGAFPVNFPENSKGNDLPKGMQLARGELRREPSDSEPRHRSLCVDTLFFTAFWKYNYDIYREVPLTPPYTYVVRWEA